MQFCPEIFAWPFTLPPQCGIPGHPIVNAFTSDLTLHLPTACLDHEG